MFSLLQLLVSSRNLIILFFLGLVCALDFMVEEDISAVLSWLPQFLKFQLFFFHFTNWVNSKFILLSLTDGN